MKLTPAPTFKRVEFPFKLPEVTKLEMLFLAFNKFKSKEPANDLTSPTSKFVKAPALAEPIPTNDIVSVPVPPSTTADPLTKVPPVTSVLKTVLPKPKVSLPSPKVTFSKPVLTLAMLTVSLPAPAATVVVPKPEVLTFISSRPALVCTKALTVLLVTVSIATVSFPEPVNKVLMNAPAVVKLIEPVEPLASTVLNLTAKSSGSMVKAALTEVFNVNLG